MLPSMTQKRFPPRRSTPWAPILIVAWAALSAPHHAHAQGATRPCHDLSPAIAETQAILLRENLPGAGLSFEKRDGARETRFLGSYGASTVIPIASASKWVSAVVLMRLVDRRVLSLDDKVGQYLPSFTGTKGQITLRQCFSHTSGLPGKHSILSVKSITLAQAIDYVGRNVALRAAPGAEFYYGGVSMSVAGRVCEVVTGKDWEQLVQDELLTPLGISTLDYQGLGATKNYRVAGSVQCRLEDYRRILSMLLHGGVFANTRVLSEQAIATMTSDQTQGAQIVYTPSPDPSVRYGIGCWLDRVQGGRTLRASSPGAFGFTPWLDFERELAGIFMVEGVGQRVRSDVDKIVAWSQGEFALRGAACFGVESVLGSERMRLLPESECVAGDPGFALRLSGAPASAPGLALLGIEHSGIALLGIRLHVDFTPPPVVLSLVTDPQGQARIPLPLPASAKGAVAAWQAVLLTTRLGATPGLRLVLG
jgi:CubicO group peptidase (beta-lactamase class C family)